MGQLTDLGFPTDTVTLPNGSLTVRGLSLDDVLRIARSHGEAFIVLFDRLMGSEDLDLDLDNTAAIAELLAESAPAIAADLIAYAADEPEAAHIVRKFPFPAQVEALEKVGAITFAMEGGPKKLVGTVIRVLKGVRENLTDLRQQASGLEESGGKPASSEQTATPTPPDTR